MTSFGGRGRDAGANGRRFGSGPSDVLLDGIQHAHAVQVVAGHATDVHDCVELLAMLGLDVHTARPRAAVDGVSPGRPRWTRSS